MGLFLMVLSIFWLLARYGKYTIWGFWGTKQLVEDKLKEKKFDKKSVGDILAAGILIYWVVRFI